MKYFNQIGSYLSRPLVAGLFILSLRSINNNDDTIS